MTKTYETETTKEKVILFCVNKGSTADSEDPQELLAELEELADTADCEVLGYLVQNLDRFHPKHYLGKGKVEELKELVEQTNATGVICDDELSSVQMKHLSDMLDIKVMDRTLLILDIFAAHAKSAEGKVQVEIAQLKYNASHLIGLGVSLSRLGGGIGTRGPGEKKLEIDRRVIRDRITELEKELKAIESHRHTVRKNRINNKCPIVSLVGYTNAGKSTLMNVLTKAGVLAENKLFATLDTTTRKLEYTDNTSKENLLITDTVGFIKKLPHSIVKAFRSTLEELTYADILIHVVDASSDGFSTQMEVVYETLEDLSCMDKPVITVFNKVDRLENSTDMILSDGRANQSIKISAKTGENVSRLVEIIDEVLKSMKKEVTFLLPHSEGGLLNMLYDQSRISSKEYVAEGVLITASLNEEMHKRVEKYIV